MEVVGSAGPEEFDLIMEAALLFAVVLSTMYASHQVADHVFGQTDKQAANKALPGRSGWAALLGHVFAYHVVMVVMLLVVLVTFSLPVTLTGIFFGIGFSAVTHAILDRRWPVRWILEHTGSPEFAKMQQPLCGMYLADQGLHYLCLWVSALLFAVL
jgi:hypothetical protein